MTTTAPPPTADDAGRGSEDPPFGGAFAGRRVLVTGITGFKGSWLALWLHRLGAQVSGFGHAPPTAPSLFEEAAIDELVAWTEGDIRDAAAVDAAFLHAEPELVIHMAAQPLVRASYRDPVGTFATNVLGTVHVLDAVRRLEIPACVNVTSDKCYENVEQPHGYRESDAMGGHDPYSASKGCAELVANAYGRSFLAPDGATLLASVRAGNVIGGGDWSDDRLIPDCIRSFTRGRSVDIRNPHATRPWQHVLEPLSGYLQVGSQLLQGRQRAATPWNFGPAPSGNATVGEVVARVAAAWGDPSLAMEHVPDPDALHEATLLHLDITKASTMLGWQPLLDSERAIDMTVAWYRARHDGGDEFDARSTTLQQILQFERAAVDRTAWAVTAPSPTGC